MSLARLALRLCTVRALIGQTIAADQVFDSMFEKVDNRIAAEQYPLISVYTDDQSDNVSGRGHLGGENPTVDLVIEVSIASPVTVTVDGQDVESVQIPATDAARELLLDLAERQIFSALTTGQSPWAQLWRLFCLNIGARVSRRGVSDGTGNRFAARQITMSVQTLLDPPRGEFPASAPSVWATLTGLLDQAPELAPVSMIFKSELGTEPATSLAGAAALLGINLGSAESLGLGSMVGNGEEPALLTEVGAVYGVDDE